MNDDLFGSLGESWWQQTGEEVRATPQQIKYAAARYSGATRSRAAELAGYSGDADALRSAGSRVDDTDTVKNLLARAAVAEAGIPEEVYTVAEARKKVGNMVRHSRDPLVVFKGTEVLAKLEAVENERELDARQREGETDIHAELKKLWALSPEFAHALGQMLMAAKPLAAIASTPTEAANG